MAFAIDFTQHLLHSGLECHRKPNQLSQETRRPVGRVISTLLDGSVVTVMTELSFPGMPVSLCSVWCSPCGSEKLKEYDDLVVNLAVEAKEISLGAGTQPWPCG